ncbi:AI-2E family transporter [Alloacidobacterium dinghuense]|uniref:AI-2E family transporter n=1 Tax=Alloacidobacterium dinghuense TaxID=2763107 RepID=A0A7G8BHB8_9BACT|nr:AI-2E family transporter [Alloacidobacterium dinghuense]
MTAILVAGVLYFARDIFIPLALAGLLSFLLAPAANWLERWKVKRLPAALMVILLCVGALGASVGRCWGRSTIWRSSIHSISRMSPKKSTLFICTRTVVSARRWQC